MKAIQALRAAQDACFNVQNATITAIPYRYADDDTTELDLSIFKGEGQTLHVMHKSSLFNKATDHTDFLVLYETNKNCREMQETLHDRGLYPDVLIYISENGRPYEVLSLYVLN